MQMMLLMHCEGLHDAYPAATRLSRQVLPEP